MRRVTLRLRVDTLAWERHLADVVATTPGLVPVIKGNGYGFGRATLAERARHFADTVAVGTVHELVDVLDAGCGDVVVLTPTLCVPTTAAPILTVGAPHHVDALVGWPGRVLVKLESSMRRYGGDPSLIGRARATGLDVAGVSIHPALAGTPADRAADVTRWLPEIDPALEVWVSHLPPEVVGGLPTTHRYRIRVGTALWHGDKSALHLDADVLDTRPVTVGDPVGYRATPSPVTGTLVMVGAGSANGLAPLDGGRSPFHWARRRLALVEPPHMHTSMVVVPDGEPCPRPGDHVDVQHPLITTSVDVVDWI